MNRFFISNEPVYRLARTIVQGVVGVLISNIDLIIGTHFSPEIKAFIVALVMAILSPIMAMMGTECMPEKPEIAHDYFEEEGAEDGESE